MDPNPIHIRSHHFLNVIHDVFCKVPAVKLPLQTDPESIEFDTIKIAKVLGGVAASLNAPCHKDAANEDPYKGMIGGSNTRPESSKK